MTTTQELAAAHLTTQSTEVLLEMSARLQGKQDEAMRAVRASVTEEIIARFDIMAILDEVYYENLDFEGTMHEAIIIAIAQKNA